MVLLLASLMEVLVLVEEEGGESAWEVAGNAGGGNERGYEVCVEEVGVVELVELVGAA